MPPFKDDQIIIIAPGSQTTLAQLGLPESFTPARFRVKSRMFPAEDEGQWEPYKVRRRAAATNGASHIEPTADGHAEYEEDPVSDDGAVWPLTEGRVTNWSCFLALLSHVYNTMNPPFHTPILLIAQPCWTVRDHERLTQFFFEKFKMPAFALMDAATAAAYAYGVPSATVIDIGYGKADVSAVSEFVVQEQGRGVAVPECGGEAMTQRLLELLAAKKFTRGMCEQLKRSAITEILPPGTALPGSKDTETSNTATNPAAAASTGAQGSGPGQRTTAAAMGDAPLGPGPGTQVGDEANGDEDEEGVLDVASIVTGGKMNEYLAQKEKEKADKAAAKKKGGPGADAAVAAQAKQMRLPNSKRDKATFLFEDHALLDALKDQNLSVEQMADAQATLDEGGKKGATDAAIPEGDAPTSAEASAPASGGDKAIRREIEVGVERFQAASGGLLDRLADTIYRTVSSVEPSNKRGDLWDSLIIVGNGAKVRGFKEALLATLSSKYVISPSSATIFTSELPSNLSTPAGTGANTPQPQLHPPQSSGVNPLLVAATTAQHQQHLMPNSHSASSPLQQPLGGQQHSSSHTGHGQSPTSIKLAKQPEYFPEWKEVGMDEATFLGAQVAAKVLFVVDQGLTKGFMTRNDYNEEGPSGISNFSL